MPLQDLTPSLRTRLLRVERLVGWFVLLAILLLLAGFGYYLRLTAERRGWFVEEIPFSTSLMTATGIKPMDPVKLMGFPIGRVTKVVPNAPDQWYGVTVYFEIRNDRDCYPGYIWSDSKVKITAADFLGNRALEVTKGVDGVPVFDIDEPQSGKHKRAITGLLNYTYFNELLNAKKNPTALHKANKNPFYQAYSNQVVWLPPMESPALTERLEKVVDQVEKTLPSVLSLTNQLTLIMNNGVRLTSNLDATVSYAPPAVSNVAQTVATANQLLLSLQPVMTNLLAISENLKRPKGALGEWLIPTNINFQIEGLLTNANHTVTGTETNLDKLVENIGRSLDNLANITSNLNAQVQANTNMVSTLTKAIEDADTFVQGLKRHWLLRSAFKTNAPSHKKTEGDKGEPPKVLYPPKKW